MSDNIADLVDLLLSRIGSEFDGEAHLSAEEARTIAQALTRIAGERDEALVYATNFLVSFVNRYCSPVVGWAPLPDLIGVLTQLDNASTVAGDFLARALSAEGERDRLADFARWVIRESAFSGCDLHGDEVQEQALARMMIVRTLYDPDRHGSSDVADAGDEWFEFASVLEQNP